MKNVIYRAAIRICRIEGVGNQVILLYLYARFSWHTQVDITTKPPLSGGFVCVPGSLLGGSRCGRCGLSRALETFFFHAGIEGGAVLAGAYGLLAFLQRLLYGRIGALLRLRMFVFVFAAVGAGRQNQSECGGSQ